MFDTYITVTGTALTTPERKLIEKTNAVVASFRVVSNARRFDRTKEEWVDGANLRIRVHCWRRLADNVVGSVFSGDPVVVYGRISTREWQNEQGETRISYELDADTVGHDLSRGRADFKRTKPDTVQSVVEDADSDNRINGELAHAVPGPDGTTFGGADQRGVVGGADQRGVVGGADQRGGDPDDEFTLGELANATAQPVDHDAMAILREAGLDAGEDDNQDGDATDEEELVGASAGSGGSGGRRRRGR